MPARPWSVWNQLTYIVVRILRQPQRIQTKQERERNALFQFVVGAFFPFGLLVYFSIDKFIASEHVLIQEQDGDEESKARQLVFVLFKKAGKHKQQKTFLRQQLYQGSVTIFYYCF